MFSRQQEFLTGLTLGMIAVFPVLIFSEVIRSGFVSTWMPLWVIFIIPALVVIGLREGARISFVWRFFFLAQYVSIGTLLLFRVIKTQGLLLAVLLIAFVFAVYSLLDVSAKKS